MRSTWISLAALTTILIASDARARMLGRPARAHG